MPWFYEIRGSNNTLLKRDGGFPAQDAAKIARRADAKKIKNSRQLGGPSIGTISFWAICCIARKVRRFPNFGFAQNGSIKDSDTG
jgi:hypothetical protein